MQLQPLDLYGRLDSPVHRIPAMVKLPLALAVLVAVALSPLRWWGLFAGIGAIVLLAAAVSRVPRGFLLRRFIMLEPLALGVGAMALFQPAGGRIFAAIVVKSTLCIGTMLVLSTTTPFSELLRVMRRLRMPGLLLTTIALMYRYLFVLADEAHRMRQARLSRTFVPGRRRAWRSAATVASQLFIRASERSERIYDAMCARGWK